MDWINIIDTAVKIGLGALISAVATFVITKQTHNHQINAEKRLKRNELLDTIVVSIDDYFSALNRLFLAVNGTSRAYPDLQKLDYSNERHKPLLDKIVERDIEFCESRVKKQHAETRLHILNLPEPIKILNELNAIEIECRKLVLFEHQLPSIQQSNDWQSVLSKKREEFFGAIRGAFDI